MVMEPKDPHQNWAVAGAMHHALGPLEPWAKPFHFTKYSGSSILLSSSNDNNKKQINTKMYVTAQYWTNIQQKHIQAHVA